MSFNFMAAVTICSDFGAPQKIKSDTVSTISPSICHEVMGLDAMIFVFWMLSFKLNFSHFSFTYIKRLFSSLLSDIRDKGGVICISEVIDISPAILIPVSVIWSKVPLQFGFLSPFDMTLVVFDSLLIFCMTKESKLILYHYSNIFPGNFDFL